MEENIWKPGIWKGLLTQIKSSTAKQKGDEKPQLRNGQRILIDTCPKKMSKWPTEANPQEKQPKPPGDITSHKFRQYYQKAKHSWQCGEGKEPFGIAGRSWYRQNVKQYKQSSKKKKRTTIQFRNLTSECASKENKVIFSTTYMLIMVFFTIVQIRKQSFQMHEQRKGGTTRHGIQLGLYKEGNPVTCSNRDEQGGHYAQ